MWSLVFRDILLWFTLFFIERHNIFKRSAWLHRTCAQMLMLRFCFVIWHCSCSFRSQQYCYILILWQVIEISFPVDSCDIADSPDFECSAGRTKQNSLSFNRISSSCAAASNNTDKVNDCFFVLKILSVDLEVGDATLGCQDSLVTCF